MLGSAIAGVSALMMLLAGLYRAAVVIVGEREAGTLETLLVSAASRRDVLFGKVAACTTLVTTAAVGNAAALQLTIVHLVAVAAPDAAFSLSVAPFGLVLLAPVLLSAALLVTVSCMAAVLPTPSFKAAELAGSFVVVFGMGPVMYSMLRDGSPWIPLGNLVVIGSRAIEGTVGVGDAVIATFVNLALGSGVLGAVGLVVARADLDGLARRVR